MIFTLSLALWIAINYYRLGRRKRKNAMIYGIYGFTLTVLVSLLVATIGYKFSGFEILSFLSPIVGAATATACYFVVRKY